MENPNSMVFNISNLWMGDLAHYENELSSKFDSNLLLICAYRDRSLSKELYWRK